MRELTDRERALFDALGEQPSVPPPPAEVDTEHEAILVIKRTGTGVVAEWEVRVRPIEQQNRSTVDAAITDALAELKQLIEFPDVPNVPGGALTNTQRDAILRELRNRVQQNRQGVKRVAQTLRHTIRYTRGDYDGTD